MCAHKEEGFRGSPFYQLNLETIGSPAILTVRHHYVLGGAWRSADYASDPTPKCIGPKSALATRSNDSAPSAIFLYSEGQGGDENDLTSDADAYIILMYEGT